MSFFSRMFKTTPKKSPGDYIAEKAREQEEIMKMKRVEMEQEKMREELRQKEMEQEKMREKMREKLRQEEIRQEEIRQEEMEQEKIRQKEMRLKELRKRAEMNNTEEQRVARIKQSNDAEGYDPVTDVHYPPRGGKRTRRKSLKRKNKKSKRSH